MSDQQVVRKALIIGVRRLHWAL